jgi:RNA polymerase sigma factor (sigma-70 family)
MNDLPPIKQYAATGDNVAFNTLVEQYVGLVFSACLRQLKDRHLAEDATQAVFILLSQKAGSLRQAYLAGWLLTVSRYACANIRKNQMRRQRREQAVAMKSIVATEESRVDLLDLLDAALGQLKAADREALVLRYLKEQTLDEVAEQLGVSQEAARKRVERGIERLRLYFSRRGMTTTVAALGPILSEQFRGAGLTPGARRALTQGILQACHPGPPSTAAGAAIAKGTKTMMILAKLKIAAAVLFVAIVTAAVGSARWMISQAAVDNSGANPVVAAAGAAASTPPPSTAPTTLPSSIELTTPENTARSFFVALKNGDRATAYACLTADPNRTPNLMDAMLAWNLAQNHLVHAVNRSFGSDGAAVKRIVTLDMIAFAIGQNQGGVSQAATDGDNATLTTNIPSWMISMAPASFQPILQHWAGKKLYFHKQSDGWRFDIDRSMRVIARIFDQSNHRLDRAATIAVIMENARATDQLAFAVDLGQIATSDAAAADLKATGIQIGHNHAISSAQFDVVPGNGN